MSSWMQLYSGEPFYPMDATQDDIHIYDIAHALGNVCRYAGHCHTFYSVAEHSWHLSYSVDSENALWALLHDAAEAYIGDIVRPLKHEIQSYLDLEEYLERIIFNKFGLTGPMPDQVKEHDLRIVVDEREQLMAPPRLPWPMLEGCEPLGIRVNTWNPDQARFMFLARYNQLTGN